MNNFKHLIIVVLFLSLLIVFTGFSRADEVGRGGYAGSFLRMGLGARAMGMGGGSAALSDEYSAYYNPAGLVFLNNGCFSMTVNSMSLDRSLYCLIYAQSFRKREEGALSGGFSAGWITAGVADIDGRDFNGMHTENFSVSENSFFFSFALLPVSYLSIGLSGKVLYQRMPGVARGGEGLSATGFGFDFGVMVRPIRKLSIGLSARDLRAKYTWDTQIVYDKGTQTIDRFPRILRVAAAYDSLFNRACITFDIEKVEFFPVAFYAGAEVDILDDFKIRAGLRNGDLTGGFGVRLNLLGHSTDLNYGYVSEPVAPGSSHIFSWSIYIGKLK